MTTATPPLLSDEEIALLEGLSEQELIDLLRREDAMEELAQREDIPAIKAERVAWAKQSLLNFIQAYLPKYLTAATPAFHYELCDIALDVALCRGEYASKLGFVGAAPRHHAKSTLISLALPLYCICFRLKKFIILFADSDIPQAKLNAANIKAELDENELIKADFGDLKGESYGYKWQEQDFYAIHMENGRVVHKTRVLSRGVGAKARGLRDREARPDLIIGDDLENDEQVRSLEQRDKMLLWWDRAVMPMLDAITGRAMIVGTVIHTDSLLARLIARAKEAASRYITRMWKAITDTGQALWAELWPLEKLIAIRQENPFAFATEYMNNPIDDEERVVRPENIRWYDSRDITYNRLKKEWRYRGQRLRLYAFVDPAISEKERADETGIIVLGITPDRKAILVLFVFHARIDFAAQVGRVIQIGEHFRPMRFGIETNVYQKALDEVTRRRLRARGIRVHPIKRSLRKYDRIKGMSPIFSFGIVHLRAACEGEYGEPDELGIVTVHHTMVDFYRQLIYYPMTKHSDMIDALEGGINICGGVSAFTPDTWLVV